VRDAHLIDRYTSRESGPALTREERDVQIALAEEERWGVDPKAPYWITLTQLYRQYLHWWLRKRGQWRFGPAYPERYPVLTRRQFGRAIRRVFAGVQSRKRSCGGKVQWGYIGLRSPWL
jgi:hypothetical protein